MRFFHKQIALRLQKKEKFFSSSPRYCLFCILFKMKAIWKSFHVLNYLDST